MKFNQHHLHMRTQILAPDESEELFRRQANRFYLNDLKPSSASLRCLLSCCCVLSQCLNKSSLHDALLYYSPESTHLSR